MPRYIGIDYGTKRIGLAVGDSATLVATPMDVVAGRNDPDVDVDAVLAHVARCRDLVERPRDEEPSSWLEVADVPRLELDIRLVRGDEPELQGSA